MGNVLKSTDNLIASAITNGMLSRAIALRLSLAVTAATATSGYNTIARFPTVFTVPSLGAGLTGMYLTSCEMEIGIFGAHFAALEYSLGTLTVLGNIFAAGVSMPSKPINGVSIQTASVYPLLFVSTTLAATTPVVTITYTDQDGNTGNTATLTLPTNAAINSCFAIHPHLAAGDSAIRAITGMSISIGTAGVLKVLGLLVLSSGGTAISGNSKTIQPLVDPSPLYLCETGDLISFFKGNNSLGDTVVILGGVAEN